MPTLDQLGESGARRVSPEDELEGEMSEQEGVSAQEAEMPEDDSRDGGEDWREELARLRQENQRLAELREQDVSKVRSTLDRKLSERDQQLDQMKQELHSLRTKDMNEEERLSYERDVLQQELQNMREHQQQLQQQLQYAQNLGQYADAFAAFGVPASELGLSSGDPVKIAENGWNAVARLMQEKDNQIENLQERLTGIESGELPRKQSQPSSQKPQMEAADSRGAEVNPPDVLPSAQGKTQGTERTWPELLTALKNATGNEWTSEDVYRAVEIGQLSSDVIP